MKIKNTLITTATGIGLTSMVNAASIVVSEDGFITAGTTPRTLVQGGGTSANLNIRTPSNPGAFQYNNLAFFGFDTTGVDLSTIDTATFTVSFLGGSNSGGQPIRLYMLGDNGGTDVFDETTLTFNSAIADFGVERNNALTAQRVPGDVVGDTNLGVAGSTATFTISGTALTNLRTADTNNFVTFVVEGRSPFDNPIGQLASKEEGNLDPAKLNYTVVPEPSSTALLGLGAALFVLRRRR